jgi:hypothetical protein
MRHVTGGAGRAREKDLGISGRDELITDWVDFIGSWLRMPPKTPIWKSIDQLALAFR